MANSILYDNSDELESRVKMESILLENMVEIYKDIILDSVEFIAGQYESIDKIYGYCDFEVTSYSFNSLFEKNNVIYNTKEIYEILQLEHYQENVVFYSRQNGENMRSIRTLLEENNQPLPSSIKIIYDVKNEKLESKIQYDEHKEEGPFTQLMNWKDELQKEIDDKK